MERILQGQVAIVTGAGRGLGRAHALELARHGAYVVVNDLGGDVAGSAAESVAAEIVRAGGEALVNGADVTQPDQVKAMVAAAEARWGQVDILVNNAGILRDRSFAKMELADFRLILDVHVMGAVHCTHAVWNRMRARRHGRIVFTTSSSGLYGNFGQSNYSAAKMALVGLMQTLAIEGEKHGIRVNCLAPTASTALLEDVLPADILVGLAPEKVSPGLVALVALDAPTRTILLAGAGSFECAHVTMTQGIHLSEEACTATEVRHRMEEIRARDGEVVPAWGGEQYRFELAKSGVKASAPAQ
ncbi:SDR family NAD(P)-dependent oxidoreductase [Herbaspirillum sp. GCM10030257]|uniref:SDR family NAD(P)-dependent oxidoreductase n=1 Tax=Herbaspirillum sp. GCM10030257 TaxID=3273393 RepID=UPI00361DDA9F